MYAHRSLLNMCPRAFALGLRPTNVRYRRYSTTVHLRTALSFHLRFRLYFNRFHSSLLTATNLSDHLSLVCPTPDYYLWLVVRHSPLECGLVRSHRSSHYAWVKALLDIQGFSSSFSLFPLNRLIGVYMCNMPLAN